MLYLNCEGCEYSVIPGLAEDASDPGKSTARARADAARVRRSCMLSRTHAGQWLPDGFSFWGCGCPEDGPKNDRIRFFPDASCEIPPPFAQRYV